jgi:hypothetical protein
MASRRTTPVSPFDIRADRNFIYRQIYVAPAKQEDTELQELERKVNLRFVVSSLYRVFTRDSQRLTAAFYWSLLYPIVLKDCTVQ